MARLRSNKDMTLQLSWLVIVVWFTLLMLQKNTFGQLGLGIVLLVGGIWALARSQEIWSAYLKSYKKLPAAKRTVWNAPRRRYYYLNVVVILPASIALGLVLIVLSYISGI